GGGDPQPGWSRAQYTGWRQLYHDAAEPRDTGRFLRLPETTVRIGDFRPPVAGRLIFTGDPPLSASEVLGCPPLPGRSFINANAINPPEAKATTAPARRRGVPCITSHSMIARAR